MIKKCKWTGNLFEVTDGEKYKCYTCQHRQCDGHGDHCSMKNKTLNFSPEQGCKTGWKRRSKLVH